MDTSYSMYAKYYDRFNKNYDFWLPFINEQLVHFLPGSKIIEYGCGTGNILQHYKDTFNITGVDISEPMLDQAKEKIPEGTFYLDDMTRFEPNEKYNIALCLFDTVNHILDFDNWSEFFDKVAKSLLPNGIFIMDANTTARLSDIENQEVIFEEFEDSYFILKLKKKGKFNIIFDVRILKNIKDNLYQQEREEIEETTETGHKIVSTLKKYFKYVSPYNERKEFITKDQYVNNESHRWFFLCRN